MKKNAEAEALKKWVTILEESVVALGEEKPLCATASASEAVAHALGKVKSHFPEVDFGAILQPFRCATEDEATALVEAAHPCACQLVEQLNFEECSDSDDV